MDCAAYSGSSAPINYLLLIGHIGILHELFETGVLPSAVRDQLSDADAPTLVGNWTADPPAWIKVHDAARSTGRVAIAGPGADETAAPS
jgi:predicted nucleic acid-binding protein